MRRSKKDLVGTAYHEAGHAVVGRVLGMICGSVTIRPDEDSAGHVLIEDPWLIDHYWEGLGKFRKIESVFRGRILGCMAGAVAEEVILAQHARGDGVDRREIRRMLEKIIPPDTVDVEAWMDTYDARLRAKCRGIIQRHRESIVLVAEALLAKETLSADQIEFLLARKGAAGEGRPCLV
jgi:ATP-dependent Zn protease